MPSTQQLREQRANIWEQMKDVYDRADKEGRSLTAEESAKYDAGEADLTRVTDELARQEAHETRAAALDRVDRSGVIPEQREADGAAGTKNYEQAFAAWMRGGTAELDGEQRKVLRGGFVDGKDFKMAQGVATGAAGGYLVPTEFRLKVIETMKAISSVRSVAEVISTDTGASLPWPTNDDTANVGAILAENTQVTEQDVVLGQATLDAYMYTSKLVRVSLQLLQDSAFALEPWLAKKLGQRIARIQNQHFTTGTGTSQPDGVQTNAVIGKTGATGQTVTVTFEDLIDLTFSVDASYRPTGKFMLSDLSAAKVRKLRDSSGGAGTGQFLWQPSTQAGQPDSLSGYGVVYNNDMPAMGANVKSILFGDYEQAYIIRDVSGFQLLRLEERYADFLQVGFLGFQRSDGTLQDSAAVRAYANSAT